jgi:serine/threonine protein kinase/Tol biopolymer transport system component
MDEEAIFAAALQQPSDSARAEFLNKACQGNAQLRRSMDELLKAHDDAKDFLATPVLAPVATERIHRSSELATPPGGGEEGERSPGCQSLMRARKGMEVAVGFSLEFLEPPRQAGLLGHLGPYDVHSVIGHGGMGIVLKGVDPKLNRIVAIKVLAPELARNALARRRFLREAQAAASVNHDHVVTTHAIDQVGDLPYIVMEYVAGESLQERIDREGPLDVVRIVRIARQTALALAAAHAQGLIHRDIKPANILLENGIERVKLGDFGLARAIDDVTTTQTGLVAGTPQYMSPEQAQGHWVDHRSDLFSLGCVIYSMCTCRSPFRGDSTMAVLRKVCEKEPHPIKQLNPDIPDWLIAIIHCLLEKDPENRFTSACEVAAILERCLVHLQDPARNSIPDEFQFHTSLDRRSATGTANATYADLDGSEGHRVQLARQFDRVPVRKRLRNAAAGLIAIVMALGLLEATGVSDVGGYLATVLRISTPHGTLVVEVDDPAVQVLLEEKDLVITGAGPKEVRLEPGRYELQTRKDGRLLSQEIVSISRGGRKVVTIAMEPQDTTPQPHPLPNSGNRSSGTSLPSLARITGQSGLLYRVRFSPDGESLLTFTGGDGFARVSRVSDITEYQEFPGRFGAGSFTPDGKHLVLGTHFDGSAPNTISVWELATGRPSWELPATAGVVHDLAITADGKFAVSAHGQWWGGHEDRDQSIRVWDLEEREIRHTLNGHSDQVTSLALSPGSGLLASGSRDGTVRLWDWQSGTEAHCFEGTGTEVFCVAISPNGRFLLAGYGPDPEVGIQGRMIDDPQHCMAMMWEIETGQEIQRFVGHRGCINDVDFSPDGRLVVTASGGAFTGIPLPDGSSKKTLDNTARVWDIATGRQLADIGHHTSLASARFSPQGGMLATGEFQLVHLWQIPEDLEDVAFSPTSATSTALLISSNRDGPFDLYMLDLVENRSGTETILAARSPETWQNLTRHRADDTGPAWSPDRERIAFCSSRGGNLDIWVMQADGSEVRQLTDHAGIDRAPCWSPDGRKIGFVRHHSAANWDVFTMDVDGSNQLNLTNHPGKQADPAWSPDGATIAYSFDADGTQLYLMDPDGTNPRLLSARKGSFTYPAWSPDGSQLVYTGWKDSVGGDLELFVIDRDGTQERQLTDLGGLNTFAAWSPGGEWIAFEGRNPNAPGTHATVYVVSTDGMEIRPITQAEAHIGFGGGRPAWGPSGHSH